VSAINSKNVLVGVIAAVVTAGMSTLISGESLDHRGGAGQACYPNSSCRKGLTCYRIRDDEQCELDVAPVFTEDRPSCFVLGTPEGPKQECYKTPGECTVAFARRLPSAGPVLSGCSK
jgi:hypothetical protein